MRSPTSRYCPTEVRIAYSIGGANDQIWIHDLERESTSPLTLAWDNIFPAWSPDGQRVAYWSNRGRSNGIFVQRLDRAAPPERIHSAPGKTWPTSWSADGRRLLFMERSMETGWDVFWMDFDGAPTVHTWLATPTDEGWGLFSPDGRWVAYESREAGRLEIYLRPFENGESKWKVSTRGGARPRWSESGRELFFWEGDQLMAVDVSEVHGALSLGQPRALFEKHIRFKHYDVTPDGNRFVMAHATDPPPAPTELQLVLNWAPNLEDR